MLKQTLLTESGEFVHLCYCLCISRYNLAIQTLVVPWSQRKLYFHLVLIMQAIEIKHVSYIFCISAVVINAMLYETEEVRTHL